MAKRCDLTGKDAQFGNNVSHAQNKTRRRFNVNIQQVTLRSDALAQDIKLKIAASTLRSIDHNGGLDNFLLTTANSKLSDKAVTLKRKVKKVLEAAGQSKPEASPTKKPAPKTKAQAGEKEAA